ncbi:MAG: radical SAM protein [Victivallales bacterium]|nr:radical SAM protein [Victivallales bacterium]
MHTKKIYLLYPPISKFERYSSDLGSVGGEQIPLGIFYLASFLRENGYEVAARDAEATSFNEENIIQEIAGFAPDCIGIGSSTVAFHRALSAAKAIKKEFPSIKIILGGPHVTSNVEHAMSPAAFDFGVIGEGEITLLELLKAIYGGTPVSALPGVAWRDSNGALKVNGRRDFIDNLDTLPFPAYDLIPDMSVYTPPPSTYRTLPVINIITSRGCPNECTFCDRNVFGRKYRERSAENVFLEIKKLHQDFGLREIAFVDDTFLLNRRRVRHIFELVNKAGMSFFWTCMARINDVDYDFLRYLKDNGCWHIAFGIESADPEILRRIKKNIKLDRVRQVTEWCRSLGIQTKGFFIIGHPGETIESIDKTIEFACGLSLNSVVVTINTPIPGSPQFAEAEKYGVLELKDWSKFNYWNPVFIPTGLSAEMMLRKQKEFYLKFYLRPSVMITFIRNLFGKGGWKRFKTIVNLWGYLMRRKTDYTAA